MEIYTDASLVNLPNGKTQGGIGIYFDENDPRNISETINLPIPTIQALETEAVYKALQLLDNTPYITIFTDSLYVVDCIGDRYSEATKTWISLNKTPTVHVDIIKKCRKIINKRRLQNKNIFVRHVYGHTGVVGNVAADRLAGQASRRLMQSPSAVSTVIESNKIAVITEPSISIKADTTASEKKNPSLAERYLSSVTKVSDSTNTSAYVNQILSTDKTLAKPITLASSTVDDIDYSDPDKYWIRPPSMELSNTEPMNICSDEIDMPSDIKESTNILGESDTVTESIKFVDDNHLFLVCMQCADTILIKYPSNHSLATKAGIDMVSPSTLALTKCRDCIIHDLNAGDYINVKTETDKHEKYVSSLILSPKLIEGSQSHRSAVEISKANTLILVSSNSVRYVPVTLITKICNRQCKVSTIDVGKAEVLPFLRIGFL